MFLLGMLFLFLTPSTFSQEIPLKRTHAISLNNEVRRSSPAVGTLNIVAVMVEFQPDTNRLTSGTGIFGENGFDGLPYLTREEQTFVDPLPHNRVYFETHLEFAKNYFLKSSDNQLTINYQVLPQVYQLDKLMEEYSPIGETFTLEKIAELVQDVWTEVETQGGFDASGLDPDNTAFVIFHAGIGRDVELTGTSLDITPFDLPSITLDQENLADLFDNSSFNGFSINNGAFRVNNSMLIPRTQSRRGTDIGDNEIVFPLSINGLLCASIGSYLGLPDLFNTENGQPGIGRFGLMDGAGFFAYNGLIPPEPSAWEKIFLGWETPFLVDKNEENPIQLPAGSLNQPNSIARIELSSTEYFLIENRHRDPGLIEETGAEVVLTTRTPSGDTRGLTYSNSNEAFVFQEAGFDSLLIPGTLVDVSNFDWSLPGGIDVGEDGDLDTADDRHLNGGILIWHIDEAVLAQQIDRDRVNADEDRRGVDLEEGDGAQDIGKSAGLLDNSPTFGFAFDFWWAGNDFRVITQTTEIDLNPNNIFGPDSYPNNNSNSGSRSFFELYDFSPNQPVASFRVRPVSSENFGFEQVVEGIGLISDAFTPANDYWDYFPHNLSLQRTTTSLDSDTLLLIPSSNKLGFVPLNAPNDSLSISVIERSSIQQPLTINGNTYLAPNPLNASPFGVELIRLFTLSEIWSIPTDINQAFLSSQNGSIIELDFTNDGIEWSTGIYLGDRLGYEFKSERIDNKFVGITGNVVEFEGEPIPPYLANFEHRLFAGSIGSNLGNFYYLFEDGRFFIIDPTQQNPFTLLFEEDRAEWPAIVDEGYIYRVNKIENQIEGYNFNGALLSNTPIRAPDSTQFIGTPLLADITGDNRQDILVVGQDNYSVNIFGYEVDGSIIEGFPLYVGGAVGKNIQPVHPVFSNDVLYAVSHTGDLRGWRFLNFTSSQWPSRYGENPYNKVSAFIEFDQTNESPFAILNKNETYNWPNPAGDETNIRFELEDAGSVEITIIDFSGRIVYENKIEANGGSPEEITVNTRDWGSGAYFARVEAEVDGRKESKTIKIAVAH